MDLEKNPKTRSIYRKLLEISDQITGRAFPQMVRVVQKDVYSCGPAVITAMYSFLGVKASQAGIIRSLRVKQKIKKYGLNVTEIGRAAKIVGKGNFVFWKKHNSKMSDLDLAVNKYKSPVGVEWQGVFYEDSDEDSGHYAIVTKFVKKDGYLRVADPYPKFSGVDRKFAITEFQKRWWDVNTIKGKNIIDKKVMFVITPKSETWPKKLGMSK